MNPMKDSGVEWIGEIPNDWGETKFKYALSTWKGLSITKANLVDEGIPVISYGQIHSKFGKQVESTYELPFVPESYLNQKSALLEQGDFIFADTSEDIEGSGNFTTKLDNGLLFAGYHSIIARLNKNTQIEYSYLKHLFDSEWFRNQIRKTVSGVKVYSITQSIIANTSLLIPPIQEQQAIANFLDEETKKLDDAKDLLQQQIEKLKEYRKSLIWETVTKGLDKNVSMKESGVDWIAMIPERWSLGKIKYFFDIYAGGDISEEELSQEKSAEKPYPVLSNSKENQGIFGYSNKVRFGKGSFTVTGRGDVGWAEPRDYDYYPIIRLLVGVPKQQMNNKFACFWINSADIDRNQTAVPQMTRQTLGEVSFPSLSFEEQQAIANFLDEKTSIMEKVISNIQSQIEVIDKQKKTLIYDYVTGKRRVEQ